MQESWIGEAAALSVAVLWTITTLIWTTAGKRVGVLPMSFVRIAIACLLLAGYCRIARGRWLPLDASPAAWLLLGGSGFLWFFVSDMCQFKALVLIGPRLSLLVLSLTPPMAAMLAWMCLGESMAMRQWIAMAITMAGVAWVVMERTDRRREAEPQGRRDFGFLMVLAAAAMQALAFVLLKRGVGNYDSMAATLISLLGALAGHVLLLTCWRRWPAVLAAIHHPPVMAIMLLGAVLGPVAGVAINMIALRHASTGVVATLNATMPVLVLPLCMFLYREKISLRSATGAFVAVLGVALLTMSCP